MPAAATARTRPRTPPTRPRPWSQRAARAQAVRAAAAPWLLARTWPARGVADRGALHRWLGAELSWIAHELLGILRAAAAARFAGVNASAADIAERLDVSERQTWRAIAELEDHGLLVRVQQFAEAPPGHRFELPSTTPSGGAHRFYRKRKAANVLLLGRRFADYLRERRSVEPPPPRRAARNAALRTARARAAVLVGYAASTDAGVISKTLLPPTGEDSRGIQEGKEPPAAAAESAGLTAGSRSPRSNVLPFRAPGASQEQLTGTRAADPPPDLEAIAERRWQRYEELKAEAAERERRAELERAAAPPGTSPTLAAALAELDQGGEDVGARIARALGPVRRRGQVAADPELERRKRERWLRDAERAGHVTLSRDDSGELVVTPVTCPVTGHGTSEAPTDAIYQAFAELGRDLSRDGHVTASRDAGGPGGAP